jgi:hypothetical protein
LVFRGEAANRDPLVAEGLNFNECCSIGVEELFNNLAPGVSVGVF